MSSANIGRLELLSIFKQKGIDFLTQLIEIFPEQTVLITYRMLFENHLPIEMVLLNLGERLSLYQDKIKNRDETFFLSNEEIFAGAKNTEVLMWKDVWKSSRLDANDRVSIWQWVNLFLDLSLLYNRAQA